MISKGEFSESQPAPRVALLGVYPPPIGGVSVHIKRLKRELDSIGVRCTVYDLGTTKYKTMGVIPVPSTRFWLLKHLLLSSNEPIVHYHGTSWKQRAALALLLKLRTGKSVYTFHSLREDMKDVGSVTRFCINLTLRCGDHFISVAPHIRDKLARWGASPNKLSVIPAYIPPDDNEHDINRLPKSLLRIRKKHAFLITANAFSISFYNNADLYGVDLSIELMKRLQESGFSYVGFVYVIPDVGNPAYYTKMQTLVRKYQLEECFHFYTQPVSYAAVIQLCDLFIRPTNTDGDALSVRESLKLGRPAIVSDVCLRPDGSILFRSRDSNALYQRVREVIMNYNHYAEMLAGISLDNSAEKLAALYTRLLSQHNTRY